MRWWSLDLKKVKFRPAIKPFVSGKVYGLYMFTKPGEVTKSLNICIRKMNSYEK